MKGNISSIATSIRTLGWISIQSKTKAVIPPSLAECAQAL